MTTMHAFIFGALFGYGVCLLFWRLSLLFTWRRLEAEKRGDLYRASTHCPHGRAWDDCPDCCH